MDLAAIEAQRARLTAEYVSGRRPPSSARGIHHTALLLYFRDPDGARLELLADPLDEMYGSRVL